MLIKLNKLKTVSKTLSLGLLSVMLFSGCSEGGVVETKSTAATTNTEQSDSVSVGESVGDSVGEKVTHTISNEGNTNEDDAGTDNKDYYIFGEDNKPQNKQYEYQKKASPELSDREILNSHLNYCTQQKAIAIEAVNYKMAGIDRQTTLQSIEGKVEKFTPLWDDVTRVIMFAYASPNTVDKELRDKIGNPSNVHQSLHPDDVANKVFIMCMQDYGHFTDYTIN